jgi:hypothetical protein
VQGTSGAASKWVTLDANGRLNYVPMPKGDHIMDFSYAGYMGGGVSLPSVPASSTLMPSGGDDTSAIQKALDAVAAKPLVGGFRGAVQLGPGTFQLNGNISISASGVILRGSGSQAGGTLLNVTGNPRTVFDIHGSGSWKMVGSPATITDSYVPSGAKSFHVDNAAGLTSGTPVLVDRPVTATWVHFMGMDTLVRNGMPQTWLSTGALIHHDRTIASVNGSEVTLDVPLSDSFDAQYTSPPGIKVTPYTFVGRISQVGIEGLRVSAPPMMAAINQATFLLVSIDAVINGWLKDIAADGFINGLQVGGHAKWLTLDGVAFTHTAPIDGSAGYPADFGIAGQQVLMIRCSSSGDHVFSFGTQATTPGPNVVYDFKVAGNSTNLAPHQRWATGLLVDAVESPTGGIDFINRATAGSGQGWAIGYGVAWNSVAKTLQIEQPPGAQNWAIGTSGTVDPTSTGAVDSITAPVKPKSLYLAQLCERLGPQAVANIGY